MNPKGCVGSIPTLRAEKKEYSRKDRVCRVNVQRNISITFVIGQVAIGKVNCFENSRGEIH